MADEQKDQPAAKDPTEAFQSPVTRLWVEKWLSAERFAPYLEVCDNNVEKALELYRWNVSLGQFLMRDISYFEVALRNAYNDVMESRWDGDTHWLLDDESPARIPVMRKSARGTLDSNRINRRTIDAAVKGLPRDCTIGSLVAELTLGFWVHLTDRSREAVIWRSNLYHAWPKGTNRAELQEKLYGILRVRNRVAHNERLYDPKRNQLSPRKVNADTVYLLKQLIPEIADYLYENETAPIEKFLKEHPVPVDVRL